MTKSRHWWISPIIGIVLLTGCRTYGGSTDEQVAESLLAAAEQIVAEFSILETEARMLTEAATVHSELLPYSERMQAIVSGYMEMTKKQKMLVAEVVSVEDNIVTNWVGKDRYRGLHRALGAIISERDLKQGKRYRLFLDLQEHLGIPFKPRKSDEEGRLQIRPHHYNQSWAAMDIQDILAGMKFDSVE